jgi:site-specific DNA recombinase
MSYLTTVDGAVLVGLKAEMRHPSVIAEYVRTYHDERKRLSANAKRAHLELRLGELREECLAENDIAVHDRVKPLPIIPLLRMTTERRAAMLRNAGTRRHVLKPFVDDPRSHVSR